MVAFNRLIFVLLILVATFCIPLLREGFSLLYSSAPDQSTDAQEQQPDGANLLSPPQLDSRNPKCPKLIQQRKGIYNVTTSREVQFRDVVLMTAVNHQFTSYLQNWEIISSELGLQWVVLSFDNATYDLLGGEKGSIPLAENIQVERAGKFGTQSYIQLVCNKLRMVLEILEECNVGIVFSDVDNVFLKDPFQHHLGSMIASGRYDYIYQVNSPWTDEPHQHPCINKGKVVQEGNTGFHYMRPSKNMKNVLFEALQRCDTAGNTLDDQTNLWNVLHEKLNTTTLSGGDSTKWIHCPPFAFNRTDTTPSQQQSDERSREICCLDPYYYPSGGRRPTNPSALVTFHANWGPRGRKKSKLSHWVQNGWRLPW